MEKSPGSVHIGDKFSEKEFINATKEFLVRFGYVKATQCHFDGDNDELADIELVLEADLWPDEMPGNLILEVKSHHSTDSQNTINKIFGQLLKEASKGSLGRRAACCFGVLVPTDGATWRDQKNKLVKRGSGIHYYQAGFGRIKPELFSKFGSLVDARYIFAFSIANQDLQVFKWDDFHAKGDPIVTLGART